MNSIAIVPSSACFGCGACEAACPKGCISFERGAGGFDWPDLDKGACVDCGRCLAACPATQELSLAVPKAAYAVQLADEDVLEHSTSGGAFTALAQRVLDAGGAVYGCIWEGLEAQHARATDADELARMRGSKYVQSRIVPDIYRQCKRDLEKGKQVVFSGTPCQVAALKCFLGEAYDNLLTVDIVCHGVGAPGFFRQSIADFEIRCNCEVLQVSFRSKEEGWGLLGILEVRKSDGSIKKMPYHPRLYPYYYYYLSGEVYRDCCYACPFACAKRASDVTIGDFWGIERVAPEFPKSRGVSLVLNNTGRVDISSSACFSAIETVPLEDAREGNEQLREPSKRPGSCDGYEAAFAAGNLQGRFYSSGKVKRAIRRLYYALPQGVRAALKGVR